MSHRSEVVDFWNRELARWVQGDREMSNDATRWRESYAGKGEGAVDLTVFPEPFVGPLAGQPSLVMLGLNPGPPSLQFQGPDGVFTQQVADQGYESWAASAPYTSELWERVNSRNKYHRDRLAFAQRFNYDESIHPKDLLYLELYPFHSKRVSAPVSYTHLTLPTKRIV